MSSTPSTMPATFGWSLADGQRRDDDGDDRRGAEHEVATAAPAGQQALRQSADRSTPATATTTAA